MAGTLRVACFATQGSGSNDDRRIGALLEPLEPERWPFDVSNKPGSIRRVINLARRRRPDVIVMEGTGLAGGVAVLIVSRAFGVPFIVSSGDSVGPLIGALHPALGSVAAVYERRLCRACTGWIGWSPYIVGRAITLGARRAMTAANWAPGTGGDTDDGRVARARLGIPDDAVVFGICGSLTWVTTVGWCYGAELVRALARVKRDDVRALIVGGGDGLEHLRAEAAADPRIILTGPVNRDEVPRLLAAMDVVSLPQSTDEVGAVRYTTKLPEYIAARRPVVTGELPFAYDIGGDWVWRLPGDAPWTDPYERALADLMATITRTGAARRQECIPRHPAAFDRVRQVQAVTRFVTEAVGPAAARAERAGR